MIVFAHTKFCLVLIQGSGDKRGGGIPRSERVFQIPVQIGLRYSQNGGYWKLVHFSANSDEV